SLLGVAADKVVPGAHISPGGFALVAMAATFGAAVRATFTSIVFLFELDARLPDHPPADAGERPCRDRRHGAASRQLDDREALAAGAASAERLRSRRPAKHGGGRRHEHRRGDALAERVRG